MRLASEVRHGPRPSVAWFAVRTIPQWDPSGQSVSHYYFGTEPAFVIETTSGFDGSHTATFTSPPFDKPLHALPGAYLAWGGANVRAVFTDDEHVRFDGEFPRIAAAGMGYKAEIAGLKLDGDWRIAGPRVDWTGETRLSIRTLAGLGPDSRAAVSNFTATTTQRAQADAVVVTVLLEAAAFSATSRREGTVQASELIWDMELAGLDKRALARYVDDISPGGQLPATEAQRADLVAGILQRLAADLLAGHPTLRLRQAAFKSPEGDFSAELTATLDGNARTEGAARDQLLQRLSAKGSARMSRALVQIATRDRLNAEAATLLRDQGQEVTERNVGLVVAELQKDRIDALIQAGLLKPAGDGFAIDLQWEGGALVVNGRPQSALGAALGPR
jgi:uncharacterized protein YdgA (DUF945 family)